MGMLALRHLATWREERMPSGEWSFELQGRELLRKSVWVQHHFLPEREDHSIVRRVRASSPTFANRALHAVRQSHFQLCALWSVPSAELHPREPTPLERGEDVQLPFDHLEYTLQCSGDWRGLHLFRSSCKKYIPKANHLEQSSSSALNNGDGILLDMSRNK